jgi:ATP-dependent RNA helicase RhlE
MKTFQDFDLPKSLQKALDELGFTNPTPIQEKAFPVILSGRDMMGIAQTGTGKTFAYLLPILKQWKFQKTDSPRVLILVPTRELVVQVVEEVQKLTAYMSVRTLGIYGGVNINTQRKDLAEGVDVLVGTPGRTMDLALDGVLRFDVLQKLVIDEFDEILNLGFRVQLTSILSMLRKRQNILFSATMTEDVDALLDEFFEFPEEVSLAPSGTPLEKIKQEVYHVPNFLTKINLLKHLLETDETTERVLLFVNNKRIVEVAFDALEEAFPGQFGVIHSNKSQNYRLQTMASFQNGELRGLITTDVMARGLDISDITHVFNLQFPEVPEQYIHRIGRTGRADKEGTAISFVAPYEEENQLAVEELMNQEIEFIDFPEEVVISEKKLEFEKDKKKFKTIGKKINVEEKGAAFHEKKDKNKKVNLGGPGKTKPRKTAPRNRAVEAKRAAKKKKR